jgi:serine/threonine-protein kinase ATR
LVVSLVAGETMHVDFGCLFDKGLTLEVPEMVPCRLTQNVVDAFGVSGVEGAFRRAAEMTLQVNCRALCGKFLTEGA